MGGCTCASDIKPTATNYGGTLRWIWSDDKNSSVWRGPPRFCSPYNCSNTGCYKKGCAQARAQFCKEHGEYCPTLNRKICTSEKCPGRSVCEPVQLTAISRGKLWCGDPRLVTGGKGGGTPPTGSSPTGTPYKAPAGCQCGCDIENPFMRSLSCVGYNLGGGLSRITENFGNFVTDAARTGGQQMPLYLMLGAGLLLVLILKR